MKKKEQEKKTSFVRLTRLDGRPIWLNASFVVTVEPRNGGGTTVVPIGDGLDYDVRETPEAVLAYLDGAPVPEVVPVPTSDALVPTPDDVSPDDDGQDDGERNSGGKTAHKPEACSRVEVGKPEVPAFVPGPGAPAAGELLEGEVARVRKMAPRTVKKLQNTIKTQFRAANIEVAISALVSRGIIVIDGTRVNWQHPEADAKMAIPVPLDEPPPPPLQEEAAPQEEPAPPMPAEPPLSEEPLQEKQEPPLQEEPKKAKRKPAAKAKKVAKKK